MNHSAIKQCCLLFAAVTVMLTGCSAAPDGESAASKTTVAATTLPPTTTVPVTAVPATGDSAFFDEGAISYNGLEIKKNVNEIETTLDNLIDSHHFLGAVYAKIGNDFEYVKAKGFANQGAHIENSIYRSSYAGGVTKLFTAAAVMKLQEEKKLSLDDTLDKYFSGCAYGKDVTIRSLLTMTSGIPGYLAEEAGQNGEKTLVPDLADKITQNDYDKNKATILSWILSQPREEAVEGQFVLSDSNYYLLGEIIGEVAQTPYETYLTETLFLPCDMNKTGFEADDTTARPYDSRHSGVLLYDAVGYSASGVITNISDMLKFIDALIDGQLISKNSVREMLTDHGDGYGYGAYVNGNYVSCIGQANAYSAKVSFTADKSQIFAAMSNYAGSDPNLIHRVFRNYLLKYRN